VVTPRVCWFWLVAALVSHKDRVLGAISHNSFTMRPHELVWASLGLIPLAGQVVARGGHVLG
jgi:hypothetical protein